VRASSNARLVFVTVTDWAADAGDPETGGLRREYQAMCVTLGREVRAELPGGEAVAGVASDVDDAGRLLIRVGPSEPRAVAAGDVIHIR